MQPSSHFFLALKTVGQIQSIFHLRQRLQLKLLTLATPKNVNGLSKDFNCKRAFTFTLTLRETSICYGEIGGTYFWIF